MGSSELSARLRYLHDSAHLLATTSPAASRHLMSKSTSLMFEHDLEPEAQRQRVCSACGTIMILGWESTLQMESQKLRGRTRIKKAGSPRKTMVYTCNSCGRATRFTVVAPSSKRKTVLAKSNSLKTAVLTTTQAEAVPSSSFAPSSNSNSKKRAKRRKQSLDAILAMKQTSEASSPGYGLDLEDFMKKA
jgi:RNase P subunit RPR2